MGERRWRAAQRAGSTTIPAIVRRTEDADLLRDALLENIHRANLNPLEEAAAYQQLLEEFDVTQEELASRLGRSRPVISNTIRLLKLPGPGAAPGRGRCAVGRSRPGAAVAAGRRRPGAAGRPDRRRGSVGPRRRGGGDADRRPGDAASPETTRRSGSSRDWRIVAVTLSDAFDTRVRLELGRTKGRIVVEFATQEDLKRIMTIMLPQAFGPNVLNSENDDGNSDSSRPVTPGRNVTVTHRPAASRTDQSRRNLVAAQQVSSAAVSATATARQSERVIACSTISA